MGSVLTIPVGFDHCVFTQFDDLFPLLRLHVLKQCFKLGAEISDIRHTIFLAGKREGRLLSLDE